MIDKLVDLRLKYEYWRDNETEELARDYFRIMLDKGLIITYQMEDDLGYLEYWRIDYETLGKIVSGDYDALDIDVTNGPIAYVANTCVPPNCRGTELFANLAKEFFKRNKDAKHIIGRRQSKRYPITVYKGGRNG